MFRPRPLFSVLALGAAAALLTACNSGPYRDVYSPRRNFYKPLPERSAADALPPDTTTTTTTTVTPPASPISGGVESLPNASSSTTPPTLPSNTIPGAAVPPPIPGLDPIPGAPAPAMAQ